MIADPKPSCGSATLVLALTNAKHKKLATVTFKNEPTNKALTLSEKLTGALPRHLLLWSRPPMPPATSDRHRHGQAHGQVRALRTS